MVPRSHHLARIGFNLRNTAASSKQEQETADLLRVVQMLLEEPEPDDIESDDGDPYYVDHELWTEYEAADQIGSGEK
jgi:hypothetical protein